MTARVIISSSILRIGKPISAVLHDQSVLRLGVDRSLRHHFGEVTIILVLRLNRCQPC
jgi:hypothetical protein